MFNKKIRIDNTCKEIIGENYSINLLNENNLYDVIYKSSICKNDLCDVDLDLLLSSIEVIKQNKKIKNDATLHRSYNVFGINKDLKECHEIIADYKKFNPYNYLLLLTKSNIVRYTSTGLNTSLISKLNENLLSDGSCKKLIL